MYIISNRPLLQEFEPNINKLVYGKVYFHATSLATTDIKNRIVSYDMIFAVKADCAGLSYRE